MDTITPKTFRIGFGETCLGLILIAQTEKGIAAIFFGNSRQKLRREMAEVFPDIDLADDEIGMVDTVAETATFINAPWNGLSLPLDLRGSDVELALWEALRAILPERRGPMVDWPRPCHSRRRLKKSAPPAPPMSLPWRSLVIAW